jgi:hypothetical protein
MEKIKKVDIFNITIEDAWTIFFETKKSLLELELSSRKEFIKDYSSKRRAMKKNIARLMMILHHQQNV